MRHLSIIGSSGSIGTQALEIVRQYPQEFCIDAISVHSNIERAWDQILEFSPTRVAVFEEKRAQELRNRIREFGDAGMREIEVLSGMEGLCRAASHPQSDTLLTSVVGMVGLLPTLDAIRQGKRIALANKETLVTAGELVMDEARRYGAEILPVDSEHSALFQCLCGESKEQVDQLILTASGGPFRGLSKEEIAGKSAEEALKHPNWSMGAKVTIDSATLMNKGLEVIEASRLFDMPAEKIQVLLHPQSVIHSMVSFVDGSVKAQLGVPSMKLPILYALSYPRRQAMEEEKIDFMKYPQLSFEQPDRETFPCLDLAYAALRQGGSVLSVLNAANEVLVEAFLQGRIGFYDISEILEESMSRHQNIAKPCIEEVLEADREARKFTLETIERKKR